MGRRAAGETGSGDASCAMEQRVKEKRSQGCLPGLSLGWCDQQKKDSKEACLRGKVEFCMGHVAGDYVLEKMHSFT